MDEIVIGNPGGSPLTVHTVGSSIVIHGHNLEVGDGYHTMRELYDHRFTLFVALCRTGRRLRLWRVWRSLLHSDGSSFAGWFVLGIGIADGHQITYHLPESRWDETGFSETLDRAPDFDGHSPQDVLERLETL